MADDELSYGEKAVGLSFNPSGDPVVVQVKQRYAEIIDEMYEIKQRVGHGEQGRIASIAITEAQTAQMWAIKAITWAGD